MEWVVSRTEDWVWRVDGVRVFARLLFVFLVAATSSLAAVEYSVTDIVEAARRGDGHAVHKLLEIDPASAQITDVRGYTALHWASIRGHWRIVSELVEAGAPVNAVGNDGGTPLHWACHHDNDEMIRLMLDKGADHTVSNRWGRTPLHVAVRRGNEKVADLLIKKGADIQAATKEGWTPLHTAYMSGHTNMCKLLLLNDADPEKRCNDGKKPELYSFTRPTRMELPDEALYEYTGHYDVGGGAEIKIWKTAQGLNIKEYAPDRLYPIGKDQFFCVQEPWRVTFNRDKKNVITGVKVDFLRRSISGKKLVVPTYVGSDACIKCHTDPEKGNQYVSWVQSRHGLAYWRLATDWAKLLARFRPYYKDMTEPIKEDRCLLCHVTAAQDPGAIFGKTYRIEEGVGCETCHGPGSLYLDPDVMTDRKKFLAAGGIVPNEETCTKCHRRPENFNYTEWVKKIDHKNPNRSVH